MRALSVRNPWAGMIADGVKTLEVRSWCTHYRGPLVIVASLAWGGDDVAARWREAYFKAPRGVTVCVVDLVDIRMGTRADTKLAGGFDPSDQYVWQLENPRRCEPVPARGRLSLFTPDFPIRFANA